MSSQQQFYITTAITYANATPHIGHAYEEIATDALARWKRMNGWDVQFVTGSDEHSANVEARAEALQTTPAEYCQHMADIFEKTWKALGVSYDRFIRTSEPIHHAAAQEMVRRAQANGDVYQGRYEGWYCNSCENYYMETDLQQGLCPIHGIKPRWLAEQNYFFRLSAYAEALQRHIETHPEFIRPETRRNEVLNIIKSGLKDISISRASSRWGIPFPGDEKSIIYVWFDALINYLSAVGFPWDLPRFERYWPAAVHVIGKDITRFHCLIWPAMLMSAKLPLPRQIFGHGFIYLKGEKISKTRGNVLDPLDMVKEYGVDPFRYVLLAANAFAGDGDFSEEGMVERYNSDLANDMGNLLNRTLTMVEKYCAGQVPALAAGDPAQDRVLADMAAALFPDFDQSMNQLNFSQALARLWDIIKRANKYIEESAPWACCKRQEMNRVHAILYNLLEVLRLVAVYLYPFMPFTTPRILEQLGDAQPQRVPIFPREAAWGLLPAGQVIAKAGPLFPRREKKTSAESVDKKAASGDAAD
ncbi:methionine--tRNA ligase [candidate division FCPU426 bacterium]|nr:methionine--tRNA ligase [candidate division FCPU426 bacterium]